MVIPSKTTLSLESASFDFMNQLLMWAYNMFFHPVS